jgi:hypothetical protein
MYEKVAAIGGNMDGFSLVGLLLFIAYVFFLVKGNQKLEDDKKKSRQRSLQLAADELAEAARCGEAALDACFKRLLKRYPKDMLIEALDLGANQAFEKEEKWDKLIKDLERNEAKGK